MLSQFNPHCFHGIWSLYFVTWRENLQATHTYIFPTSITPYWFMVRSQFLQVNSSSFLVKAKSPFFAGQLPIWYHILRGKSAMFWKNQNTQVLRCSNPRWFSLVFHHSFPAQEELLPAAGALMTVAGHLPAPLERSFWDAVARQLEATRPEAGECVNSWGIRWRFNGILIGFKWDLSGI